LRIVEKIEDLNLPSGGQIGFVPTMGAFHEGHLQLMRRSKESTDYTVVSLFVNPLQFGQGEDFDRYPRNLTLDSEMAESVGVDALFVPAVSVIYPNRLSTVVSVPEVTECWEGAHRPGHFDGVATVVAKLLNIVQADIAFFGRKDFQQCAVVQRMVADLNIKTAIAIEPTVREPDGLALSSRNRYLSEPDRQAAPSIYKALIECREQILAGAPVASALAQAHGLLEKFRFSVDYFAYVSDNSLQPIEVVQKGSTLICAAKIGSTRLIDNLQVA
jgi:pantoate--beta-alanine ligase